MRTVTATRELPAPPDAVREAILDIEPFTRAAGFDEVRVDGRRIEVANDVGITEIALELEVVDDADAVLAYEQREGIFEEMRTTYTAEPTDAGTRVRARTEFALDVPVVGEVLDATVITRQRRAELNAQFDHLESVTGSA
ncbi:SRPBCC family protein [Halobaculum sp. WSA2]|uniref:SRPBCC family protein n=1 Tax=Halobaculum saliterrae TaxID=2073113 RepID=A0A6B0T1U2_9EURY|nr:SRPBCC family protein [Halobaculum saliterrae]MXR42250.1 SRPBCC family protein [Halobaculum saliterrae]